MWIWLAPLKALRQPEACILLSSSNNISIEAAELPANAKVIHKDLWCAKQLTEWGYFGKSDNISVIN